MKRCIVGIQRPDGAHPHRSGDETPQIWFSSLASLAAVLSDDNRRLLRLIHEKQPKSLTELAGSQRSKGPEFVPYLASDGGLRSGLVAAQCPGCPTDCTGD